MRVGTSGWTTVTLRTRYEREPNNYVMLIVTHILMVDYKNLFKIYLQKY